MPPLLKPAKKTTAADRNWNAADMRRLIAELKTHMAMGRTDVDIADAMELDNDALRVLKREMYNRERTELNGKSTEEFFVDYKLRQEGVIAELDRMVTYYSPQKVKVEGGDSNTMMVEEFSGARYGGQPSAIVGALRAKSDIIDKIVKVGQEFGILEKAPEKKLIVGGIAVAQMGTEDLRKVIVDAVTTLKQINARWGDTDVMGNPLPDAKALAAKSTVPIQDAVLVPAPPAAPKFSDKGKPKEAVGGLSKVAGANKKNRQKATQSPPVKV